MSSVAIQQSKETGRALIASAEEAPASQYNNYVEKYFNILDSQIEDYNFIEIFIYAVGDCYYGLYNKNLFKKVINDTTRSYTFNFFEEGSQRAWWIHSSGAGNKNKISLRAQGQYLTNTAKAEFYIYGIK